MNLYKISQDTNTEYETCDSAVVAAPDMNTAQMMNPSPLACSHDKLMSESDWQRTWSDWAPSVNDVKVQYLGVAHPDIPFGVIVASFNRG